MDEIKRCGEFVIMWLGKNLTDQDGNPVVFTYSICDENTGVVYQYLPICPFCGGNHLHGLGEKDWGNRVSHCTDFSSYYKLVCLGAMPPYVRRHY